MLLKGFKVLVIDDDPDLRELVSDDLQFAGADVDVASNALDALVLVGQNKYDFTLSDLRMPKGDGKFLAQEIQKMQEPKPLVFLYTGYNDFTNLDSEDLGISGIFTKPFEASELIQSILAKIKKNMS